MTDLPSLLYSDVETDLRSALRAFLADRASIESVLQRSDEATVDSSLPLWHGLGRELDVLALPFPASAGGADASWLETAVILEELGRSVADVPYLTSSVMAGSLLAAAGADELLAGLGGGSVVCAIAHPFTQPLGTQVNSVWDGRAVNGSVASVAGALEATHLLVPAGNHLLAVDREQVSITQVTSLDMTRRLADVTLTGAAATVIAEGNVVSAALASSQAVSSALLASEQLGVAEHAFDATVSYLRERKQFGRTIGSYQALKHRMADTWTALVQARAVARYAAVCAAGETDASRADLALAASLAQSVCGPAAVRVTEESIQLHGGIGFTWELPEHLYLKRARVDALALGTPSWHRRRVAALAGLDQRLEPAS